jgi:uncharacterized protein (DUF2141 family)
MRLFALVLAAALVGLLAGCERGIVDPQDVQQNMLPGTISGLVVVDPDANASAAGVTVELYCSCDDYRLNRPMKTTVTDASGRYSFEGICCGTHYLAAWKDMDQNGWLNSGDFSVNRNTPDQYCCQLAGQGTMVVNIAISELP